MAAEAAELRRRTAPRSEPVRTAPRSEPVRTVPRAEPTAAPARTDPMRTVLRPEPTRSPVRTEQHRPAPRAATQPRQPQPRSSAPQGAGPRVVPGRPRPLTTGQIPVARTRVVPAGPVRTEQLPVIRPDLPVRGQAPERSRLREAPTASPRPARRPVVVRSPPPAPEAPTARGRHPMRDVFAVLAALGLVAIHALPSLAAAEAPPVAGIQQDGDVQQFSVGDVDASGVTADGVSGDMPVVAPSWVVPLHGELRDGFGPRLQQPVAGVSLFHRGQDIGGGCGAAIHAAAAGRVETTGWWGTYGNWTLIDHGNGIETGYAHQARIIVHPGQQVKVGQVIGYEGNTGASTGCHLHLEVHINGVAVNPVPFFRAKGIPLGS
ncbi:peptidoglycan DD-metalloendopeptidase family protein [Amnibacterium endophyticum]|uniref:Peptidoglycan DD-metalloendopeptidase family protein n=1 Tax=Amnibacterium endophyticum TaxID=2109337 RepID=A0ABW4LAM1_9MICO